MPEVIVFPDIEAEAVSQLEIDLVTYDRPCPVSATTPTPRPPEFVTVRRVGGPRRDIVTDSASLAFECWAETGSEASSLAELVRGIVRSWQGQWVGDAFAYRVQEFAGPASLPDPASDQPRYTFTASIDVRGHAIEPGGIS